MREILTNLSRNSIPRLSDLGFGRVAAGFHDIEMSIIANPAQPVSDDNIKTIKNETVLLFKPQTLPLSIRATRSFFCFEAPRLPNRRATDDQEQDQDQEQLEQLKHLNEFQTRIATTSDLTCHSIELAEQR